VYAHGGFAFDNSEFAALRPALDRGFAVFTPTFRGENGNGGNFEYMFGEVDDLAEAVRAVAKQPEIDPARIYVLGHSSGGGLVDLLALRPDVPVRLSGSIGSLYFPEQLRPDPKDPLFPADDLWERLLRTMVPSIQQLAHRHVAYFGNEENIGRHSDEADAQLRTLGARLEVKVVDGDHFTALPPALTAFLSLIERDGS
jgi:acetyl esterase/lipase